MMTLHATRTDATMRTHLTILLAVVLLLPACDRIESALSGNESSSAEQPDRPKHIEFVVDGEGVYYATRGADGKIHNAQRLDGIPLSERGTTFVYVEGETPELRGREERYVADLSDAHAGDTRTATLREPDFVRASEAAGLSGARAALHVHRRAQPEQVDDAPEPSSETLRRGTPEPPTTEAAAAQAPDDHADGIEIESIGGSGETNSLGFGNSKSIARHSVTVYYAEWCGVCKRAMQWMDRNGVDYRAVDIEASDANRREMVDFCRRKGRSPNSVPTIRVGDRIMKGWSATKFEQLAQL